MPPPTRVLDIGLPPTADLSFALCNTPAGSARRIQFGGLWLHPSGFRLVARPQARRWAKRRLVLGVVADARSTLEGTLANLRYLERHFAQAKVDAVVALGGWGINEAELRRLLMALWGAGSRAAAPLMLLPGDQLPMEDMEKALTGFGHGVVNLRKARSLEYPGISFFSLPGARRPHHLASARSCIFTRRDIGEIGTRLSSVEGTRVLLAYVPPRGATENAVDISGNGTHLGDPLLADIVGKHVAVGLFASVPESGGRATTNEGDAVPERQWAASLLLNVGSIDAVPLRLVDGRWSRGMAALVEIRPGRARFRIIRPPATPLSTLGRRP